jgi:hypothetical protein
MILILLRNIHVAGNQPSVVVQSMPSSASNVSLVSLPPDRGDGCGIAYYAPALRRVDKDLGPQSAGPLPALTERVPDDWMLNFLF